MDSPMLLNPIVSPADQSAALRAVLDRVAEVAARCVTPIVEIDLDLTAVCPVERTRRALAEVGRRFEVAELDSPPRVAVLPGYTDEAWDAFVLAERLPQRYPDLSWHRSAPPPTPFSEFHACYWTTEWLRTDDPAPGLGEFVRRVEDRGGVVVFLSGRWQVEQVPPTLAVLRRAGIAKPVLLIGNPRHARNVVSGESPWSDAEVKGRAQEEIRVRYGIPVAVFDDRASNRELVIRHNADCHAALGLPGVLGVGVAIPGFTNDPATASAGLRVSTFESGCPDGCDPRREPYLASRYGRLPSTPYRGLIAGLGRNGRGYVLPRRGPDPASFGPPSGCLPHFANLANQPPGSLTDEEFMDAAERSLPPAARSALERALTAAQAVAAEGVAHPFPDDPADQKALWRSLVCSWLHSRDLEVVMAAVGYALPAMGVHDMTELVPAADVIAAVVRSLDGGNRYSPWFLRWAGRLDRAGAVNVDFLNPHLTVGTWRWREGVDMPQDAMDAHRVSGHHQGDGAARYDPVEATVNNLLHAREGVYGVQKTPVVGWDELEAAACTSSGAAGLAKSGWGGGLLCDAIPVMRALEEGGYIMPWWVVRPTAGGAREGST
jgi:hypothetical protein